MPTTLLRRSQIKNILIANNLATILHSDNTETVFSNSAAENTLWSYTVPGGVLGIHDAILVLPWFSIVNNSGGTVTYTVRLKYGGTTLLTIAPSLVTGASTLPCFLFAVMKNNAATNAQKAVGRCVISGGTVAGAQAGGTSAIDSTVNQTIAVTIQASAATATQTVTSIESEFTILKNT